MSSFIQKDSNAHYQAVASVYNESWFYDPASADYHTFIAEKLKTELQAKPEDKIVDLGGGTGHFTAIISQVVGSTSPVLCVEPSAAMLEQAEARENVEPMLGTAQSFCKVEDMTYDCVFFKEVIHHIPDDELVDVLSALHKQLAPGGRLTVITRMQESDHYPFFAAAHQVWRQNQPHYDILCSKLKESGFEVGVNIHDYPVEMPKERWYRMVRNRFWSTFADMSDEQIEAGLRELEQEGGKLNNIGENITFPDRLVFVNGRKKSEGEANDDNASSINTEEDIASSESAGGATA